MPRQTAYTADPAVAIKGMLAVPADQCKLTTAGNPSYAVAKVYQILFADTWAPADTALSTIDGIPVSTTVVGATATAARDEHYADLIANAFVTARFIVTSVSTDKIYITARVAGTDFTVTTGETTAGDGSMTESILTANAVAGDMEFGEGVNRDPNDLDDQVIIPSATGQTPRGVTVFSHAYENRDLSGQNGIPAGDAATIMEAGVIWVEVEQDVDPTSDVYLRHTANGALSPGSWRKDADSAKADLWPNARYRTVTTAGNLAQLEIFNTGKDRT